MALQMFLRVDGITGGTANYGHRGWADILSYRWALARDAADSAVVRMNEISVEKHVGIESTGLMTLFAARTPIGAAELSVLPTVGKRDVPMKYLTLLLEDVLITSISTGGGIDDNAFKETITLQFGRVKYESHHYGEIGPAGAARTTSSHAFSWDLANGSAC